jgi:hypothetical protein
VDPQIVRVIEMFNKRLGHTLAKVWTQQTSMNLPPTEMDHPTHTEEVRIVLDFKDDKGAYSSIIIHFAIEDDGVSILGFHEQDD